MRPGRGTPHANGCKSRRTRVGLSIFTIWRNGVWMSRTTEWIFESLRTCRLRLDLWIQNLLYGVWISLRLPLERLERFDNPSGICQESISMSWNRMEHGINRVIEISDNLVTTMTRNCGGLDSESPDAGATDTYVLMFSILSSLAAPLSPLLSPLPCPFSRTSLPALGSLIPYLLPGVRNPTCVFPTKKSITFNILQLMWVLKPAKYSGFDFYV